MTSAFNVDISDIDILPQNLTFSEDKLSEFMQDKAFTKKQNEKKVLDGKRLEESWFKPVEADFFISRKSEDADKARRLGAYLQSKEKTVFIDSSIWGDIAELQRLIDNDYCMNEDKSFYIYDKRNKSTSYTHMLLANALLKTIANCKNLVFLNTHNSVKAADAVTDMAETNSPWIYFEINVANSLLIEMGRENFAMRENENGNMIEMAFEADLQRFDKVNVEGLLKKVDIELPQESKEMRYREIFERILRGEA